MNLAKLVFNNFLFVKISFYALVFLILVSLVSCAPGEPTPLEVSVSVKRVKEGGFSIKWTTKDERKALVFARGTFRSELWQAGQSGSLKYKIHRLGDREIIEADQPTQAFEVFVPELATDVAGDYSFLTRFADGAVLLFSGYLDVTPIRCSRSCGPEEVLSRPASVSPSRFTLATRVGEQIIVDSTAGAFSGNQSYRTSADGSFFYFGRQNVLPGRGYRIVPDQNIPKWVLEELMEVMPKLIQLHSEKFGRPLGFQPLIFLPHLAEFRNYHSSHSGAVLGQQMVLSLFGDRWFSGRLEERSEFRVLMAHEAFHLWNASLFKTTFKEGGHWLHEGSADAFAFLSLLELGLIAREELSALKDESLNRCLFGLSDSDLLNSKSGHQLRNHYNCGAVIQNLLHSSLQLVGSDLWSLWAQVFERADEQGGIYGKDLFFDLAAEETENETVMAFTRKLILGELNGRNGVEELQRVFLEAHQAAGEVMVFRDQDWPEWYRKLLGEQAIASSLVSDCGPQARMTVSPVDRSLSGFEQDRIRLISIPQCQTLRNDVEVTYIGGLAIFADGVRVYDLIRRTCGDSPSNSSSVIELSNTEGGLVRLSCPQLPARPAYAHISF